MDSGNLLGAGQIRNGAGDPDHAMETARRQPHRRRCVGEQLATGLVRRRYLVEELAVRLGVPRATD